jgi:hypothetical protein
VRHTTHGRCNARSMVRVRHLNPHRYLQPVVQHS